MIKTALMIAFILAAGGNANAQTKEQCSKVTAAFYPLLTQFPSLDKAVGGINWNLVTSYSSGQFKNAAESAQQAQMNLLTAWREYRIALEDVVQQGQLCAR